MENHAQDETAQDEPRRQTIHAKRHVTGLASGHPRSVTRDGFDRDLRS